MANLKTFSGFPIQNLTSDPVPYAQALADNPYGGVWSSGGTRNEQAGAIGGTIIGTQTAAVAAGGNISGSVTNKTEEYNGTGWTAGNTLGTARRSLQAAGLESAGLVFGGDTSVNSTGFSNLTETYNGSSWSEVNELTTARGAGSGAGLSTAAVAIGGSTGPGAPNYSAVVENWNGSSWTNGTSVNTARIRGGAAGIQTSLLFFGGQAAPGASNSVELWNGSSWTETTEINTARGYAGSAGETSTAALFFGGSPNRAITESWDGSSWTEVADMATGQSDNFGVVRGSNQSALSSGGDTSPNAASEEWSFSGLNPATTPAADYSDAIVGQMYYNSTSGQFKAIKNGGAPIGAWASGTSMNTAKGYVGSAGNKTALLVFGGSPPYLAITEQYDGSAWTEVTDLNTARSSVSSGGTSTAAFCAGGRISSTDSTVASEEWNGTSWAEGNDLNLERYALTIGMGSQTAGLAVGGNKRFSPSASPEFFAGTEEYNGTSWTEVNDLPTAMESAGGIGTQTAAGQWGGYNGSYINSGFLYDGTSWTTTTNFPISGGNFSTSGTTTAGLMFGIYDNGPGAGVANNLSWDGTSFTEVADLATARNAGGGPTASLGTASSAILAGGNASPYTTATEEWTAADFTINPVTTS